MEEQYSVFVNAGAIVLLSRALEEQEQQDVLHSLLLAQLVANKKYPGFTLGDGWYETCQGVLKDSWLQRAVAWDSFGVDADSKRAMLKWVESQPQEPSDCMTIANVVGVINDIARLPCTHPAVECLREKTLRHRIAELPDGSEVAETNVRLQIIVVEPGAVMNSLFVEFKTAGEASGHPLHPLFSSDKVSGNIQLRWFQANLSSVLYASIRDAIARKLGDNAAKNIHSLFDDQPAKSPATTDVSP